MPWRKYRHVAPHTGDWGPGYAVIIELASEQIQHAIPRLSRGHRPTPSDWPERRLEPAETSGPGSQRQRRALAGAQGSSDIRWRDPRARSKSQTKSQRPQTRGVTRPRPATIVAASWHFRRCRATSRDGLVAPYKRGVTGSNPVAPTRFTQLEGAFREGVPEPACRQEPNKVRPGQGAASFLRNLGKPLDSPLSINGSTTAEEAVGRVERKLS